MPGFVATHIFSEAAKNLYSIDLWTLDLREDPDELDNLAVRPKHQKTLKQLRAGAIAELRRTGAGFVDRMPPVRKSS